MNIQVNDLSETRKGLAITLDPAEVETERQAVVGEFSRQVRLPGFRPGKAPAGIVQQKFGKEIADELRQRIVGTAYQKAVKEQKIDVLRAVTVDEFALEAGKPVSLNITVDVRPTFTMPDYAGLATEVEPVESTEAEVDAVIEQLRSERADFKVADRAAAKGDFVKLAYEGQVDGKPIAEIAGDKQIYAKVPQTWEEVEGEHDGVIPGLGKQLAGVKAGEKKDVSIAYPAEFAAVPALAGKTATYTVEVQEIRERVLPALDEAFFKGHQVDDLAGLKSQVTTQLKMQKEHRNRQAQRRQVTEALAAKVQFPVPESMVDAETQSILRQFIEENMRRGVPADQFEKDKKELFEGAKKSAATRVKLQLLLARIAEQEKITVSEQDLDSFIYREAVRSNVKPDKLAKDLARNREQLQAIQESIIFDKAVDFLVSKATVTTASPKA